jgi:glyoxylase-like metal-dependent hydrolase (beta-lactamase superfamily II)
MLTRRNVTLAAAGIGFAPPLRAQRYTPGAGLEVVKIDRPGEGSVNSFLLVGPRSVVVIDGQRTLVEARQVVALARGLGLPVEAIVLTHEHPDHCGGLTLITDAFPQAPLLASEPTRDWLARNGADMMAFMRSLFGDRSPDSVPLPSRVIRPGERLTLAGAEFVVDQLGPCEASEGMTLLYSEPNSLLVAADLFGNRATPWLLDGTTRGWISELEKAAPRYAGVATALPGHGAAAPAAPLIAEQLGYLRDFHALVRGEARGGATLDDAAKARIRATVEARHPGAPRVAPQPNLIELNADAVAKELAGG